MKHDTDAALKDIKRRGKESKRSASAADLLTEVNGVPELAPFFVLSASVHASSGIRYTRSGAFLTDSSAGGSILSGPAVPAHAYGIAADGCGFSGR